MQFGIHNPSFLFQNSEGSIFDQLKHKVQWAEDHGFVWFDLMDHMIQIAPGVGDADDPFMESWTTLAALAAVTKKFALGRWSPPFRIVIRRCSPKWLPQWM